MSSARMSWREVTLGPRVGEEMGVLVWMAFGAAAGGIDSDCALYEKASVQRRCERLREAIAVGQAVEGEAQGEALRVATLNIGMLHLPTGYTVPRALDRRALLGDTLDAYLRQEQPDVLLLQECFRPRDQLLVDEMAQHAGYLVFDRRPAGKRTGMLTLVRDTAFESLDAGFEPVTPDLFIAAGYARGVLWVRGQREDGSEAVVGNVHLTPLSYGYTSARRTRQTLDLVELARDPEGPLTCAGACVSVLGGDFNFAPGYEWSATGQQRARAEPWLEWDRALYEALASVSVGEVETVAPGLWTLDAANAITNPDGVFGASRRVDLLFALRGQVASAHLAFDEPLAEGLYLSDHFGVGIQVQPAEPLADGDLR